ncbi:hypothetical protein [Mongoliimonas terrestris]|uniref:hypothetical protein n=1 Tax=Mongoliimonas terrestris TaxID=1709001 RepID=UPI000AF90BF1|nr:hypothetical protein [Mongoliimonas terrestris]
MTTPAQRRALATHRRRTTEKGLVRVEVRVPNVSAPLIQRVAERLRNDPAAGERIEAAVLKSGSGPAKPVTWGELLSNLPDVSGPEYDEVFETTRGKWTMRPSEL